MLVQAQVVPWWGTGDRQSSVPANPTPSQTQPTGRRIAGYDHKTESFHRPRVEQHAHFRKMRNQIFLFSKWTTEFGRLRLKLLVWSPIIILLWLFSGRRPRGNRFGYYTRGRTAGTRQPRSQTKASEPQFTHFTA